MLKPGCKDQLHRLLVGDLLVVGAAAPSRRALRADRREVEPAAVVRDLDDDLGALALQP